MLGLTPCRIACKVTVMRIERSWPRVVVLACLGWLLIGLPALACGLGWALR